MKSNKFRMWMRRISQQLKSWKKKILITVLTISVVVGGITLLNISIDTVNFLNIDKVVLSDDNELNSIISTRAVSVDFDNDSINYPIFEESPTCAELSETEANNSSSDKIYSLKWETEDGN